MKPIPSDATPEYFDIPTEKLNVVFNPRIIQSTMKVLFRRKELESFFSGKKPVVIIPQKGKSFSNYLTRVVGTDTYTFPRSNIGLSPRVHDIVLILFHSNNNYYASQCEVKRVDYERCEVYSVDLRREKRIRLECQAQVHLVPETVKQQLLKGEAIVRRIPQKEGFVEEVMLEDNGTSSVFEPEQPTVGVIKDISTGGLKLEIEGKALKGVGRGTLLCIRFVLEDNDCNASFSLFAVVRAVNSRADESRFFHCSFLEIVDALEGVDSW